MEMAAVGGVLFGTLLFLVVMLVVAAFILKLSVRMVEGFSPGFGRSLATVALAAVIGFVANIIVSMAFGVGGMAGMGLDGSDPEAAAAAMASAGMAMMGVMVVSLALGWLINAFCVNLLLRHPDGRAIGFGRSLLVSLLYLVILTIIGIVIGVVLGLVLGAGAMGLAAGMGG